MAVFFVYLPRCLGLIAQRRCSISGNLSSFVKCLVVLAIVCLNGRDKGRVGGIDTPGLGCVCSVVDFGDMDVSVSGFFLSGHVY